ncbi:MAG: 7-carboxy-7-deazaguanine synthase QueE [Planctomycetota bacterium]|nr:7-carboxy-7-deazaguanine synthase QueE [Planctomycetota bacterium]MDJ0975804.1 7-carboxy-7-deazaguanine synthase QueE [Planctomycetota bacterium]
MDATSLSGVSVPLLEVFSTFQGEGPEVGARQVFIRLARCDLRCAFCDTPESYPTPEHGRLQLVPGGERDEMLPNPVAVEAIVAAVKRLDDPPGVHAGVSITGGEPLLHPQAVREIAVGLFGLAMRVHLETGGHRPGALKAVLDVLDSVSPDLKLESACEAPTPWDAHGETYRMLEAAGKLRAIKAVVGATTPPEEVAEAAAFCAEHAPSAPLVLQPVTPYGEGPAAPPASHLYRLHAAAGRLHPDVRVIPQVHHFLNLR